MLLFRVACKVVDQIRYHAVNIRKLKLRIYVMVMYFVSVLVLISMSCPAVVRRGAHVCVICVCRGVISFLFFFVFFLYL